jgi:hypothetical protein
MILTDPEAGPKYEEGTLTNPASLGSDVEERGTTTATPLPLSHRSLKGIVRRRKAKEKTGTMDYFQIHPHHSKSATVVLCRQLSVGLAYVALTQGFMGVK